MCHFSHLDVQFWSFLSHYQYLLARSHKLLLLFQTVCYDNTKDIMAQSPNGEWKKICCVSASVCFWIQCITLSFFLVLRDSYYLFFTFGELWIIFNIVWVMNQHLNQHQLQYSLAIRGSQKLCYLDQSFFWVIGPRVLWSIVVS